MARAFLVGLQLPVILRDLGGLGWLRTIGIALAVAAVVVAIRVAWVLTTPYLVRALDRRPQQRGPPHRLAAAAGRRLERDARRGLSGRRPVTAAHHRRRCALPGESELLIFVAFAVVLVTLLVQGLTLPAVCAASTVRDDGADEREELLARRSAAEAAIDRLKELAGEDWARADTLERMRGLYEFRRRHFAVRAGDEPDEDGIDNSSAAYQRVVRAVIEAQRATLVRLRNDGAIGNGVMQRVERDLDLEDSRLEI